jgi:hypothetical protein
MTVRDMIAGGLSKSQALKEYRLLHLKVRQMFVTKIFGPLLSATKTGCRFSFKKITSDGGGEGGAAAVVTEGGQFVVRDKEEKSCYEERLVVPVLRAFLNDNQQANELCGNCRSTKFVKMGCRFCTMRTVDFYTTRHEIHEYDERARSGKGQELVGRQAERYRLRRLHKKGCKRSNDENLIAEMILKYSLQPIDNPMFEVFEFSKVLGIPYILQHPPDRLHTFQKGPVECTFKMILILLKRLEAFRKDDRLPGFDLMVKDTCAELDRRILENFDYHRQPFNFTGEILAIIGGLVVTMFCLL